MILKRGNPQDVGMSEKRVQSIENLMSQWVEQGISPAIVTLIARRGTIVSHRAFGRLGPEADSPLIALDTLYPMASMTKPVTATCIMILLEEGLLDLNRPVSKYIPEFTGEGKNEVMIHHLLTHTSGLRDSDISAHAEKKKESADIPLPESTQYPRINEVLFLGYDTPLWKAPGREMSYCNYGYRLLGEIVRRISGQSLNDFARERIFHPLGMKDTFYIVPDSLYDRVVRRRPPEGWSVDWFSCPEAMERPDAAGGLYSTVLDMAIFGQTFLNGGIYGDARILSPASVREMTCNQIPGVSAVYGEEVFINACWGYGWNVRGNKKDLCGSLRSAKSFNHGGAGGVSFWIDPVYETVSVYFSVDAKENIDLFNNTVIAAIEEL